MGRTSMLIYLLIIASMVSSVLGCSQAEFSAGNTTQPDTAPTPQSADASMKSPNPTPASISTHPENAKSQGHFTAWLESFPPGYIVVVEIALPSGSINYQLTDLSGTIIGTDGWTQNLTTMSKGG